MSKIIALAVCFHASYAKLVSSFNVCVCRCVYSAAVWYYNHLAGMMNIVMITEDPEAVAQLSSLTSGVYVISVQVCEIPL